MVCVGRRGRRRDALLLGSGRNQHPIARPIATSAITSEANVGHRCGWDGAICGEGAGLGAGGAGGRVDILLNVIADQQFR
jgi:hypothetical protein